MSIRLRPEVRSAPMRGWMPTLCSRRLTPPFWRRGLGCRVVTRSSRGGRSDAVGGAKCRAAQRATEMIACPFGVVLVESLSSAGEWDRALTEASKLTPRLAAMDGVRGARRGPRDLCAARGGAGFGGDGCADSADLLRPRRSNGARDGRDNGMSAREHRRHQPSDSWPRASACRYSRSAKRPPEAFRG